MKRNKVLDNAVLRELKRKVIDVAREMFNCGLVTSTFGVVSARIPKTDHILITPSGFCKAKLDSTNLIVVDLNGELVEGSLKPSVETTMHTYIHERRPELQAVLHTHSPFATAFAAANREIPCVSAEQAFYFGGRVPLVTNYSLPGTTDEEELNSIVGALKDSNAILLRKHGSVVVGETLEKALDTAIVLEDVAKIALFSMLIASPSEFTRNELDYMKEFKKTRYGQKRA
ncbi:class II aldolase/adducin family protein [Candidatus Bathyarchaeota archaeon]|nr:class II aldolase/adducin family protein [Candidatus Bathyarchaeota archaeon]